MASRHSGHGVAVARRLRRKRRLPRERRGVLVLGMFAYGVEEVAHARVRCRLCGHRWLRLDWYAFRRKRRALLVLLRPGSRLLRSSRGEI